MKTYENGHLTHQFYIAQCVKVIIIAKILCSLDLALVFLWKITIM